MGRMTKEQRSKVMSRIRSSNTKAEIALFKFLTDLGFWYQPHKHVCKILGKPDYVKPESRIAIFVDGCFWHGCPIHYKFPKSNQEFWINKLGRNQLRDLTVTKKLQEKGWKVIRIWEHIIMDNLEEAKRLLLEQIDAAETNLRLRMYIL